ncbi:hypothetical protein [Pedobacter agri]|uniref:hypothetical protein n=1 Tax=Pedobacter agri TaxID=454586 RepID=UPI00292E2782|nr:hypothetical protein [Pedobacter agri]
MSQTIKIFISSSIKFVGLRDSIRLFFDKKNKIYNGRIFFETVVCEDFDNHIAGGSQNKYNDSIKECQYMLLFYSNRVGIYTREEFAVSTAGHIKTYIYKLPDDISSTSIADADSVKQFSAILMGLNYFQEEAENVDQLLNKFYHAVESKVIVDLVANPVMNVQSFLSKKLYRINREDPIAYFNANLKNNKEKSCTLFFYKAKKRDQPNYYNYRLDEMLNQDQSKLTTSFKYIDLNRIFQPDEDVDKWLIRFLDEFNNVFDSKLNLASNYASSGEFITAFYDLLKCNDTCNLILPFRLVGQLELNDPFLVKNIIDFLKLFDFKKNNGNGIFLHFVFNLDIDEEKETLFYNEVKNEFNVQDYTTLKGINKRDFDQWAELYTDNGFEQEELVDKIIEALKSFNNPLPTQMAYVERAVQKVITNLNQSAV